MLIANDISLLSVVARCLSDAARENNAWKMEKLVVSETLSLESSLYKLMTSSRLRNSCSDTGTWKLNESWSYIVAIVIEN